MEQLVFATYSFKLSERGTYVDLNSFGENESLINVIKNYFDEIHNRSYKTAETSGKYTIHFRLSDQCEISQDSRSLFGLLSSGVSGDQYDVYELDTDEHKAAVGEGDGAFRDVFFYIHIPQNTKTGYLILQRKSTFGIKTVFGKALNKYLKERGYNSYTIKMFNLANDQVYRRMMQDGELKKVELIRRSIPSNLEEYMRNGQTRNESRGTLRTTITNDHLPDNWLEYMRKLFLTEGKASDVYEIEAIDDRYEEVEFQVDLNGKTKTFFVVNHNRIQRRCCMNHLPLP